MATAGEKNKLSKLIKSLAAYSTAEDPTRSAEIRTTLLRRLREVTAIIDLHDEDYDRRSTIERGAVGGEHEEGSGDEDEAPPLWKPWNEHTEECFECFHHEEEPTPGTSKVYTMDEREVPSQWIWNSVTAQQIHMWCEEKHIAVCQACRQDRQEWSPGQLGVPNEEVRQTQSDSTEQSRPEGWHAEQKYTQCLLLS